MRQRRPRWWLLVSSVLALHAIALVPAFAQARKAVGDDDPEVKMGRENATEFDKTAKFVIDPQIVERVNRIGQELATLANTTEVPVLWGRQSSKAFQYSFKVLQDKDVNAFSLPGGFIYVNKGTIDFCKSDDELAGVVGHEIVHAAHHHMAALLKEQEKIQRYTLIAQLAGLVFGKGDTAATVMMATEMVTVAKLNTYGVEAEKDADQAAVRFLAKSRYNPVGLLTFMERLARQERLKPEIEMGIYRTHPPSPERAQALVGMLGELSITVNRRTVDPSIAARVQVSPDGSHADVQMNQTVVATFASAGGKTAEERARKLASDLDRMFDAGLKLFDIRVTKDGSRVIAMSSTLIAYTAADAASLGKALPELSTASYEALRYLIWQDQFNQIPTSSGSKETETK